MFAKRFTIPARFIYCRGTFKKDGTTFRINVKGPRTKELINENKAQLPLFQFTASTASTSKTAVEEVVANLWIIADTSGTNLVIYLVHSIDIIRHWDNKAEMWHEDLVCSEVRQMWGGSLFETNVPDAEKPEPVKLDDPILREIDDEPDDMPPGEHGEQFQS